jgi:hypothetical protein
MLRELLQRMRRSRPKCGHSARRRRTTGARTGWNQGWLRRWCSPRGRRKVACVIRLSRACGPASPQRRSSGEAGAVATRLQSLDVLPELGPRRSPQPWPPSRSCAGCTSEGRGPARASQQGP